MFPNNGLTERRCDKFRSFSLLLQLLSIPQKFTVKKLTENGFSLCFVRDGNSKSSSIAVLSRDKKMVSVNFLGQIDENSQVKLRRKVGILDI